MIESREYLALSTSARLSLSLVFIQLSVMSQPAEGAPVSEQGQDSPTSDQSHRASDTDTPIFGHVPTGERQEASSSRWWMKLSVYVLALRPWSFSASLVPVLLGSVLAYKVSGEVHLVSLLVSSVTAVAVHAAGNVVNTLYDYERGVDRGHGSDNRLLVDRLLSSDELASLAVLLYSIGCCGFGLLALLSPARIEHLAMLFFGGLSSSFLYTGGPGLKYVGLGDLLILVIFGPISVLFAYVAQTGGVPVWSALLYAVPLALNTETILHSNNTRDLEWDRRAAIVTLAIVIGRRGSLLLYAVLLFAPYVMLMVCAVHYRLWPLLLPCLSMPAAFAIEREFRTRSMRNTPQRTAKLTATLGVCYVLAILMCHPQSLPFLH